MTEIVIGTCIKGPGRSRKGTSGRRKERVMLEERRPFGDEDDEGMDREPMGGSGPTGGAWPMPEPAGAGTGGLFGGEMPQQEMPGEAPAADEMESPARATRRAPSRKPATRKKTTT
ncbi:MAG TPA: hypothetical protein VJ774_04225, partial [Actinomycetota bacterium]|nr:hypothetical protein [Actinomycetota bacterium]